MQELQQDCFQAKFPMLNVGKFSFVRNYAHRWLNSARAGIQVLIELICF